MGVHDDLHRLIDQAMGSDAPSAVAAVRLLQDEHLPWLERRAVALARREGIPWAGVARLLGVTRQAVHRRYAHLVTTETAALPRIPPHVAEREAAEGDRILADSARDRQHRLAAADDDPVAW